VSSSLLVEAQSPLDTWRKSLKKVNCVPVNYAIRFSDPVTGLTARHVRHGVGADLTCQPDPRLGIKAHSPPATFPTDLSVPLPPSFFFFTVLHRPPVVPQATASSTGSLRAPGLHRTDTAQPVGKMPQHDHQLLFARRLSSIISSTVRLCVDP
jgi:hypothetical protein